MLCGDRWRRQALKLIVVAFSGDNNEDLLVDTNHDRELLMSELVRERPHPNLIPIIRTGACV